MKITRSNLLRLIQREMEGQGVRNSLEMPFDAPRPPFGDISVLRPIIGLSRCSNVQPRSIVRCQNDGLAR